MHNAGMQNNKFWNSSDVINGVRGTGPAILVLQGDNDPVDVVEIGGTPLDTAGVYSVKALGAYAMIDGGELDWKIICIRSDHPLAPVLNDIADVES